MSWENYDPCFPDQPVVDLYLPIWATQPAFQSKPAFIWAAADDSAQSTIAYSCITYSQLNSSAQSIANKLLFPLQRGNTLLVLCSPGLVLAKILFACQRAGVIAIPVVPPKTSSYHHLSRVINQTKPKAAIVDDDCISSMAESYPEILWLSVESLDENSHEMYRSDNYAGCRPHEPYLVQYTSGATGIPKPVVVTAGAAAHNVRAARRAYDLHPSSVITSWLPQYHDCGLMFLLLTIVSGATCVLTSPAAFLARPRLWLELVSEFKATCTPVPSFALPLVNKRGGIDNGDLYPLRPGEKKEALRKPRS
ncbi:uncharacterized protein A4U43_C05F12250 [Asparagus officinalis]|uniref:AMP-dependent synthetase/ligase domain-containing protein n=1 Tax=Asparagus officinalis TaxID=4686 RepID=A0A5P1ER55_ASPOF|nr:uncharacterized protein A4U43_C05F12250 [Asparagus officinalis]